MQTHTNTPTHITQARSLSLGHYTHPFIVSLGFSSSTRILVFQLFNTTLRSWPGWLCYLNRDTPLLLLLSTCSPLLVFSPAVHVHLASSYSSSLAQCVPSQFHFIPSKDWKSVHDNEDFFTGEEETIIVTFPIRLLLPIIAYDSPFVVYLVTILSTLFHLFRPFLSHFAGVVHLGVVLKNFTTWKLWNTREQQKGNK